MVSTQRRKGTAAPLRLWLLPAAIGAENEGATRVEHNAANGRLSRSLIIQLPLETVE
jgi:hypothetical protein